MKEFNGYFCLFLREIESKRECVCVGVREEKMRDRRGGEGERERD
jgi:hypothetical protein